MDKDRLQLSKRHSFPYMQVYSWNILDSGSQSKAGLHGNPEETSPQVDAAPVINSDGTSEEREARLEAAILWIRKELSDMRHQDKYLTRQFIQLRTVIQRLKSENSLLEELEGNADGLKEPALRHSIPGPTLRQSLERSLSIM